jgi:hypothetical protein
MFKGKTLGIFVSAMVREFATELRAAERDWKTGRIAAEFNMGSKCGERHSNSEN